MNNLPNKDDLPQNIPPVAVLVAFCGGYFDVYTYIKYGTLTAAQTGNLIFMSTNMINQDMAGISLKLRSLFGFLLGAVCEALLDIHKKMHIGAFIRWFRCLSQVLQPPLSHRMKK